MSTAISSTSPTSIGSSISLPQIDVNDLKDLPFSAFHAKVSEKPPSVRQSAPEASKWTKFLGWMSANILHIQTNSRIRREVVNDTNQKLEQLNTEIKKMPPSLQRVANDAINDLLGSLKDDIEVLTNTDTSQKEVKESRDKFNQQVNRFIQLLKNPDYLKFRLELETLDQVGQSLKEFQKYENVDKYDNHIQLIQKLQSVYSQLLKGMQAPESDIKEVESKLKENLSTLTNDIKQLGEKYGLVSSELDIIKNKNEQRANVNKQINGLMNRFGSLRDIAQKELHSKDLIDEAKNIGNSLPGNQDESLQAREKLLEILQKKVGDYDKKIQAERDFQRQQLKAAEE